jgi:hypothetical protein
MESLPYISKVPCSLLQGPSIAVARPRRWVCHRATRPTVPRGWFPYLNGTSQGEPVLSLSKEHPRTPGFRLVEPTARREGRPFPWSQQVIHEISGLGCTVNYLFGRLIPEDLLSILKIKCRVVIARYCRSNLWLRLKSSLPFILSQAKLAPTGIVVNFQMASPIPSFRNPPRPSCCGKSKGGFLGRGLTPPLLLEIIWLRRGGGYRKSLEAMREKLPH